MSNAKPESEAEFLRLLLHHENALRAFARCLLPDWNAVDDVFQDASIVMWQKIDQLESSDGFLPWGKVIVRFHCLRHCERVKANKAVFSDKLIHLLAEDAEQVAEQDHERRRQALRTCMSKLSSPQQELLLAPYLHHGRIKELADLGGVTPNALYKKLGRVRQLIRKCLQERLSSTWT